MTDRKKLPFRKNCEGFFICEDRKVIARDTGKGYIEFPGGGVDKGETPKQAVKREAYEETGVLVENVKKLGKIYFVWSPDWPKTEKQKKRYQKYQGEEMHFFTGKVKEIHASKGDGYEEGWNEEGQIEIDNVIKKILEESSDKDLGEYREFQLKTLKNLKKV